MQCTPWLSFSQFEGRESTLPVITISIRGIDLEKALNSRCAVIEVLQYIRREVPTIRASQQHHPEPPWVWLERPSMQSQGHQKVFHPRNRYLPTLTPRYQADPKGTSQSSPYSLLSPQNRRVSRYTIPATLPRIGWVGQNLEPKEKQQTPFKPVKKA